MSEQVDQQQTVEDALARRVERRRGAQSPWAEALRELGAVDRAVYQAVAVTPTPPLDDAFRRLSTVANYSRLWLGMAAAIATLGGRRGRRVAFEGVLAIGATSASVNLGVKPLAHRRRPDRPDPAPFEARLVPMPESTSFPSGHAASAFAFAYTVGRHYPALVVPIRLLASGVAYPMTQPLLIRAAQRLLAEGRTCEAVRGGWHVGNLVEQVISADLHSSVTSLVGSGLTARRQAKGITALLD